nr:HNH endonuclease signature motif containing protein [Rhodanobacter glycinis]
MNHAEASSVLDYNPVTGRLAWKVSLRNGAAKPGDEAGFMGFYGYRQVRAFRKTHLVHRVCWLLHYGEWPSGEIDHINCLKTDNRIKNLRVVSKSVNQQNKHVAQRNSSSGILGVIQLPNGRWRSSIKVDGTHRHLGMFATAAKASAAYQSAKSKYHDTE